MGERLKKKKEKKCRYAQNETNTKRSISSSNNNNTKKKKKKKSTENELAIKRHDSRARLMMTSGQTPPDPCTTPSQFFLFSACSRAAILYSPLEPTTFRKCETGHPWP